MKISKVDNVRTCVVVKDKTVKGDIYKFPKKQEVFTNVLTIDEHLSNRIKSAKNLYNIFNLKNAKNLPNVINQFNSLLMVKEYKNKKRIATKQEIKKYIVEKPIDIQEKNAEEYATEIMNKFLRKSLRKHKTLFIQFFSLFSDKGKIEETMQETEIDQKIEELIKILSDDFNREKQKLEWMKSIENQNVRVQVEKDSQKLALASYFSEKEQKKDIFNFLVEFTKNSKGNVFDFIVSDFVGEKTVYENWLENVKQKTIIDGKIDFKALKKELSKWSCSRYKEVRDKEECIKEERREGNFSKKMWLYAKIQDEFESYISKKDNLKFEKLSYENVRKMLSTKLRIFLMYKFVDIGKAVYHFCDIKDDKCDLKSEYKGGITSFDYEMIKAEEKLQQNLSASLIYSIHHFSQTVVKGFGENNEIADILTIKINTNKEKSEPEKDKKTRNLFKENEKLRLDILRFWGGLSQFKAVVTEEQSFDFFVELKNALYSLRNRNFHYGKGKEEENSYPILEKVIEKDKARYTELMLKKYQHNNVFAFFDTAEIVDIMEKLHSKEKFTAKFIPSFATIFKKKDIFEFTNEFKIQRCLENKEQYFGALYFLLKEIYYYDFLGSKDCKKYFDKAIGSYDKEIPEYQPKNRADNKKDAWRNFKNNINLNQSLSEICQNVLISYSLQNQEFLRDKIANKEQESFKSYKMILNKLMYLAFKIYIEERYASILLENKNPKFNQEAVRPQFLEAKEFQNLSLKEFEESIKMENKLLYEIYVMAKFLQPRQLNFLIGDIEGYIHYVSDIYNRSGAAISLERQEAVENFRSILQVLRFCMVTNGQISGIFKDYYEDKHAFARQLRNYVDFSKTQKAEYGLDYEDLEDFLADISLSKDEIVSNKLYIDGQNPILFRGIELSRMYGVESVLSKVYLKYRITKTDLNKLKALRNQISEELPKNEAEFCKQREYQNHRGKVELFDIQEYSNIIFDLYTPLIQWCYLWERDSLYYLLGYYYVKQYWAEDKTMYQAMLQNIYNAYHYGRSVEIKKEFMPEWDDTKFKEGVSQSALITKKKEKIEKCLGISFENIESYLFDKKPKKESKTEEAKTKKDFNLRNNIDHFHYFYGKDGKSIFELYENMYQKLKYDRKLQNNLMQRIEDTLQRYHLEAKVIWDKMDSEIKPHFKLSIKSEKFEMKTKGKHFTADAKTKEFCEVVQKILEYKV